LLKNSKKKIVGVWMENGCQLAWLTDPKAETTYLFRANGEVQMVTGFDKKLSGKMYCRVFKLDLGAIQL